MKIIDITTEVKYIALKTPFVTALRRVENIEFVRVRIEIDNGLFAYGEAPATKAITGEGIEDILESITSIKEKLYAKDLKTTLSIIHNSSIGSSAKASLDMAIVTLMAKDAKQPIFKYLGAIEPCILDTDVTISLNPPKEMLKDAHDACNNGMNILKVKVGSDILHSIDIVQLLAKEIPSAKLIIDANQAWSVDDSLVFIDSMKNIKIELIEQPIIANDIEGLKIITDSSDINILADEAVFTLEDAKNVIQTCSADMINIKLMKCGGITKAVEILEYAREKNVQCMLGSMLEGPLSINIALHLAIAYNDVITYIDLDSPLLYKEPSVELEFSFSGSKIVYNQYL